MEEVIVRYFHSCSDDVPAMSYTSYTDIHSVSTVQSTGVVTRQQSRTKAYTKPQAQCISASVFMNEGPTTTTTTSSTTTQPVPGMPLSQHDLHLLATPVSQHDLGLPMPRTSSRTDRPVATLDLSLSAIDEPHLGQSLPTRTKSPSILNDSLSSDNLLATGSLTLMGNDNVDPYSVQDDAFIAAHMAHSRQSARSHLSAVDMQTVYAPQPHASSLPPLMRDPVTYSHTAARSNGRQTPPPPVLTPQLVRRPAGQYLDDDEHLTSISQRRPLVPSRTSRVSRRTTSSKHSGVLQTLDINAMMDTQARLIANMLHEAGRQQTRAQELAEKQHRQLLTTITKQNDKQQQTLLTTLHQQHADAQQEAQRTQQHLIDSHTAHIVDITQRHDKQQTHCMQLLKEAQLSQQAQHETALNQLTDMTRHTQTLTETLLKTQSRQIDTLIQSRNMPQTSHNVSTLTALSGQHVTDAYVTPPRSYSDIVSPITNLSVERSPQLVVRPQFEVKEFSEVPVEPSLPPKVTFVDNLIDLSPVMDDQNCTSAGPGVATDTVVNVVHTSSSSPATQQPMTTMAQQPSQNVSACVEGGVAQKETHTTDGQSKATDEQSMTANIVSPVVTVPVSITAHDNPLLTSATTVINTSADGTKESKSITNEPPQKTFMSDAGAVANQPVSTLATTTTTVTTPSAGTVPTVVVKQYVPVKPYSGATSWRTFQDHFTRVCRINGWTDEATKVGHLSVSLEGPAAEVLRDLDETAPDAWNKIWSALKRRFGNVDDQREAMYKFDICKQTDDMTIPEYETKLRLLHAEAWPHAVSTQRDSDLKRKFEDGLQSCEMKQFLRLHAQTDTFDATVAKARQFFSAQEATKPRKAIRILETDHDAAIALTPENAIIKGMESVAKTLSDKLEQIMLLKASETAQAQSKDRLKNNNKKQNNGKPRNGRNGQNNRPQGSGQNQNLPSPQPRDDTFQQAPVPRFRSPSPGYNPQSQRPQSPGYDDRRFDYHRSRTQYPYRPPSPYSATGSYRTQSPNRNQSQFRTYSPRRNTDVGVRDPPSTRPPGRPSSPGNLQQRASRPDGRQFNAPPRDEIINWRRNPSPVSLQRARSWSPAPGCWVCGLRGCHSRLHEIPRDFDTAQPSPPLTPQILNQSHQPPSRSPTSKSQGNRPWGLGSGGRTPVGRNTPVYN